MLLEFGAPFDEGSVNPGTDHSANLTVRYAEGMDVGEEPAISQ